MGINRSQLEAIQDRLARKKSGRPDTSPDGKSSSANPFTPGDAVLLGIDPSLRGTGYGKIRVRGKTMTLETYGVIRCPASWTRSRCLGEIHSQLSPVLEDVPPDCCIFEGLFFSQNLKTAIIMGEARGASLAAAGIRAIPSYEIAPRKVKQALVGFGAAQKSAVSEMVQRFLKIDDQLPADAADALALAIAFAHTYNGFFLESPKGL